MRSETQLKPDFSAVRNRHILIALSGGADSTALACLLAETRDANGLKLSAAHLDHAIRAQSAGDAECCRALCQQLDIPFYTARIDVPAESARSREGLETAARRLRYAWLRKVKDAVGADCIALAHHMDDQAETVLMHLARGTGPEGISGMRVLSGDLFRPLLGFHKRELTEYLNRRGIPWREDDTNAECDTPRNAIRLHVLPELEKSYPQFSRAAARYAQSAAIESDYVAQQTLVFLDQRRAAGPYGQYIALDAPVPRAVLRRAIRAVCGAGLSWEKLNAVESLCAERRGRLEISGNLTAERTGRGIYFLPKPAVSISPVALSLDGESLLPGLCTVAAHSSAPIPIRDDPMRQVLNRVALEGAVLRTRRPGDRIRPLGCGERLLSDYLTDKKIDHPLRDCIVLAAKGDRILWACGLGISEEARLDGSSNEAVELEARYTFDMSFGINK